MEQLLELESFHQRRQFLRIEPALLLLIGQQPEAEATKFISEQLSAISLFEACHDLVLIKVNELLESELQARIGRQVALPRVNKLREISRMQRHLEAVNFCQLAMVCGHILGSDLMRLAVLQLCQHLCYLP